MREDFVVKSIDYSCRGSRFNSHNPHDGSQLSITLVPRNPLPFWPLSTPATHIMHRHTCRQNPYTVKIF